MRAAAKADGPSADQRWGHPIFIARSELAGHGPTTPGGMSARTSPGAALFSGQVAILNVCSAPAMSAIPAPIQSVLDLFEGPLANVRFADIDANGLAKLAAEVEAVAAEAQRQEEALAELRQGLAQRQEALLSLAQQALAYARVYAESDEPLLEELNRISLPRAAKGRKPNAAKAGAKDPARSESTAAVSADTGVTSTEGASVEEARVEEPSVEDGETPSEDGDSVLVSGSAKATKRVQPRHGRKPRGSAAQRSAAE
jgi:hypothetical protein